MKLQLSHIRLLVSNYKDSFLFYRDVLELDVDWGDENTGYAEFLTGNIKLALFPKDLMISVLGNEQLSVFPAQDRKTLVFAVDDVDEVYQRLKDHYTTIVTPPIDRSEWGIRTAHFRDPDGNLLEIYNNLGILS
ncbi:VOC family protein [Fortiea contorta]|uniref:VOC family protein n=1 Tax=Fortiea contorta TaxID=1892405 RepID=UPI000345DDCF|nr:VOC family protein [Fortiea contorta]